MPTYKVVVDTTPRKIVVHNPRRVALAIRHLQGEDVYISEDPVNIVEQGFPLFAGDGLVFRKSEGDTTDMSLWACTRTGTAELRIWEMFTSE